MAAKKTLLAVLAIPTLAAIKAATPYDPFRATIKADFLPYNNKWRKVILFIAVSEDFTHIFVT